MIINISDIITSLSLDDVDVKAPSNNLVGSALLTKRQAAKELQISQNQIDALRRSGELKFSKVGSQIRVSAAAIADFMVV